MLSRLFSKKPGKTEEAAPHAASSNFSQLFGAATGQTAPPEWQELAQEAPEQTPGQQIEALLARENWPELESRLASLPRDAEEPWILLARMKLARAQQKPQAAVALARRLQKAETGNEEAYVCGCSTLNGLQEWQQAEDMALAGLAALPGSAAIWIEAARAAEGLGSLITAEERWARVRQRLPGQPTGWIGACELAMSLQQQGKTSALLEEAMRLFPAEPEIKVLAARQAATRKQWAESERYWRAAIDASGGNPHVLEEAARSVMGPKPGRKERMHWALAFLAELGERHPDFEKAYPLQVSALVDAGQAEAAAELGQKLRSRAPRNGALAIACAQAAAEAGRPEEKLAILLAARAAAPPSPELEAATIEALSQAGDRQGAESISAEALERFAGDSRIIEHYVGVAMRAGDMDEAARRAVHWRDLYPQNRAIVRLAERLEMPGQSAERNAAAASKPLAALFARFESLGAHQGGCEFGFIQSRFGAEPISLLRWANMGIDGLIRALDHRFEGLGEPEHTKLKIRPVGGGEEEYFVRDDRYGYVAHTFIKTHEAPGDKVFAQTLRRIRFMREKLVQDLALAEKIFVFKINTLSSFAEIDALDEALRGYGHITLLCVCLADEEHPGGTVEMLRPGLFLGRVNMLGGAAMTRDRGIDGENWRAICEQVAGWVDAQQGVPAA